MNLESLSPREVEQLINDIRQDNIFELRIPSSKNAVRDVSIKLNIEKNVSSVRVTLSYGVPYPLLPGELIKTPQDFYDKQDEWHDTFFSDCLLIRSKIIDKLFEDEIDDESSDLGCAFDNYPSKTSNSHTKYSVDYLPTKSKFPKIKIEWWYVDRNQSLADKIKRLKALKQKGS